MTGSKRIVVLGIMLSLFMASMEATVVATAMPTIVGQLGGLDIYSWVFSAYMLASTATVPVFGKLSDLYGRRPVYLGVLVLFLAGSVLCGAANSMGQLIASRVVQGLGAGGVLSLAFIIVGALFTFEERARMTGIFSSVWGFSSIVGPLIGGFLVDQVSWPWVFYINVLPGVLAGSLIWFAWRDEARPAARQGSVDYAGAALLTASVVTLLLGLFQLGRPSGWPLLASGAALLTALWAVERRASDPVLPLRLLRDRLFASASAHGVLSGFAVFGSLAFVPLFVQVVLGTSATRAGATLTPLMLGWVVASTTGGRLMLRISYRTLALAGMTSLTVGSLLLFLSGARATQGGLVVSLTLMGAGMGLSVPTLLIAVQTSVPRRVLGTATAMLQFTRSIGGAVGVSVMGLALSLRLSSLLRAEGLDPGAVSLNRLLDPMARGGVSALDVALRAALAQGAQVVFLIALGAAALGLAVTAAAPRGRLAGLAAQRDRAEARAHLRA